MADKPTEETRKRVLRTHRWDPLLIEAVEAYADSQEVPPTEIAILEVAVREFLAKRGFWPPHEEKHKKGK